VVVYLARKFGAFIVTLLLLSITVFIVLNVLPGDPAYVITGIDADPAVYQTVRDKLNLDYPVLGRYFKWLGAAVRGDLGSSITLYQGYPIASLIGSRLRVTLPLTTIAMGLTLLIALPLSMYTATHHNRIQDYVGRLFMQLGMILPEFWLGILLILLFAVALHWAPVIGTGIAALILPAIALSLPRAAVLGRMARAGLLETLGKDYILTARAKGLSERHVAYKHALRNTLTPLVTVIGLLIAQLIAGSLIVETVFGLQGIGQLAFRAVGARDLPLIQAITVIIGALIIAVNFAVDLLYGILDPRIRYQ
jgi:peptide/nickel transport system permease protein